MWINVEKMTLNGMKVDKMIVIKMPEQNDCI